MIYGYRFSCPVCGSRLEGESQEFVDIGGKVNKFFCPVCREDRYIPWSNLRKNITYERDIYEKHVFASV